ncbi:MAG: CBS domain-containing protein [bacterium]|nr:CBS domain-containing protein [bacterium]
MNLTANNIMSTPVVCVHEETTVKELLDLLHDKQISGVPVVDANRNLVGVISITDLIALGAETLDQSDIPESDFHTSPAMDRLSEASGLFKPTDEILDRPVRALMSSNVITATEQTSIGNLAGMLVSNHIHRLVIVKDDRVSGIVSTGDILRILMDRYSVQE